jgi:hypothetical protein
MYGYATGAYPRTPHDALRKQPPSLPSDRGNFSDVLPQREGEYHVQREAEARERHAPRRYPRDHGAEYADKGESMAEQIPEAWIGQEVTVYFGLEGYRQPGILESVSERGILVQSGQGGAEEHVFWYPHTSVLRLMRGKPRGAEVRSY